jgi:hypothetical protein
MLGSPALGPGARGLGLSSFYPPGLVLSCYAFMRLFLGGVGVVWVGFALVWGCWFGVVGVLVWCCGGVLVVCYSYSVVLGCIWLWVWAVWAAGPAGLAGLVWFYPPGVVLV